MAAQVVYRGMPVVENGVVISVNPIRGVEAADGAIYRGALDYDSRGNAFVYRKIPDNYADMPRRIPNYWDDNEMWNDNEMWADYTYI